MMIAPAARAIKSPTVAFVVIAVVMYICASFFWPTPATALVGTILNKQSDDTGHNHIVLQNHQRNDDHNDRQINIMHVC